MNSKKTLHISTFIALILLPIVFRRKYRRQSIVIFILSAITNVILDKYYLRRNSFVYSVRYLQKFFKISVLYDLLVLPIFTVIYCQTSTSSSLTNIFAQGSLYTLGQVFIEWILERKTKLIKYNHNKWSVKKSAITLFVYMVAFRGVWAFIDEYFHNNYSCKISKFHQR